MAKDRDRRYIGTSHLFNVSTNHEFVNGLDIRDDGDDVSVAINSAIEPERRRVFNRQGRAAAGIRDLIREMEQESLRARRQAGEFAIPKKRREPPTEQPAVCPACGGRRGNEDEDGNWVECEACGG